MMKKLLTLTLLLSALAQAGDELKTIKYNTLLDSTDGWTFTNGRNQGSAIAISGGTASASNINWGQKVAANSLTSTVVLRTVQDTLAFSFTINQNGTNNAVASVALVGNQGTIVAGMGYSNDVKFTTTTTTAVKGYVFSNTAWGNSVAENVTATGTVGTLSNNSSLAVSGQVAWNDEAGQFALTMDGYTSATPILLGQTFSLSAVTLAFDGPNSTAVPSVSNMSITANVLVPEPATATLSLLALAGLAARRRRK